MNSFEAIKIMLSNLKDEDIALFTTGFISRYGFCANETLGFSGQRKMFQSETVYDTSRQLPDPIRG